MLLTFVLPYFTSAALYMILAIFLSPIGGLVSNLHGRRKAFLIFNSVGTAGWILIALSPNVSALMAGRVLTAIASGGLNATVGQNNLI